MGRYFLARGFSFSAGAFWATDSFFCWCRTATLIGFLASARAKSPVATAKTAKAVTILRMGILRSLIQRARRSIDLPESVLRERRIARHLGEGDLLLVAVFF